MRPITIQRKTNETKIDLQLQVEGQQLIEINSGIGFLDHMLAQLAFHASWDLTIQVSGDLEVDDHHSVEDIAICLGQALQQAWRQAAAINRYGQRLLPMDESLILAAVDLCGRGTYVGDLGFTREKLGDMSCEMFEHFFRTLANNAAISLHLKPLYFGNNHHLAEGCFKALALALKEALANSIGSQSTKGSL